MANTIRANTVLPYPEKGIINRMSVQRYYHRVVLGAGGAISSQDAITVSGMTATKTGGEVGRYTLQLARPYKRLLFVDAKVLGTDDAAYGANTLGLHVLLRDNDVDSGAADGTVEVQFLSTAAYADAEVADSVTLLIEVTIADDV